MSERVPFLDLKAASMELREPLQQALSRCLDSGWYILGQEVQGFEREFANWVGSNHCVGVANGLEALQLGLLALGVGTGDEVIVPSNTYIATWLAVTQVGATPVPVEPDERTWNIDPERVEKAITKKTKVILPVHLYGQAAALGPLMELAKANNLKVLDDAAQSHGAEWEGARVGAAAHLTAWSFYPGKNLGALGDAGAVTTNDAEVASAVRVLSNYGSKVKYVNERAGMNSRLDEMQAALLRAKLPHLDAWNGRRRAHADVYLKALQEAPGLVLPHQHPKAGHVWHLFTVHHPRRDQLQAKLKDSGVDTMIHYPIPPFRQQAYADFNPRAGEWPIADRIARQTLSLPMGPHLSAEQRDRVIVSVISACRELA